MPPPSSHLFRRRRRRRALEAKLPLCLDLVASSSSSFAASTRIIFISGRGVRKGRSDAPPLPSPAVAIPWEILPGCFSLSVLPSFVFLSLSLSSFYLPSVSSRKEKQVLHFALMRRLFLEPFQALILQSVSFKLI